MISYVTEAFRVAGCEPIVVVSPKTPMTANWCRARDIIVIRTEGNGYIEDMVQAVKVLDEKKSIIISVSDIPCITSGIITKIIRSYTDCRRDALSTWVPADKVQACRGSVSCCEQVGGTDAFPAGVNILRGDIIDDKQDEYTLLLYEPRLALNVNTKEDLARAEEFLQGAVLR
jgi:adenosylcobinamide-phosphate guanylyltransferase